MAVIHRQPTIIDSDTHDFDKRGARVFGTPISREVSQYVENVSKEAKRQRVLSMFFAQTLDVIDNNRKEGDIF